MHTGTEFAGHSTAGHGVQFIDGATILSSQPTYLFANDSSPDTGPLEGGTRLSQMFGALIGNGNPSDNATLSRFDVGNTPGWDASSCIGACSSFQVTTPASDLPGPVDLTIQLSDGATASLPEAFTYGPTIVEVTTNGARAEGGQVGTIIGYGFGDSTSGIGSRSKENQPRSPGPTTPGRAASTSAHFFSP